MDLLQSAPIAIPGTEAQAALDVLSERFPQMGADGASARVVVQAPDGQTLTDPANLAAVQQLVTGLQGAPLVAVVADPLQTGAVNPAKTLALIQVNYSVGAGGMTPEARDALVGLAAGTALADGTPVYRDVVAGLLDPAGYLGANDLLIDRVLAQHEEVFG